jgi:hypothetical protein
MAFFSTQMCSIWQVFLVECRRGEFTVPSFLVEEREVNKMNYFKTELRFRMLISCLMPPYLKLNNTNTYPFPPLYLKQR